MYGLVLNQEAYNLLRQELLPGVLIGGSQMAIQAAGVADWWGIKILCHPSQRESCREFETASALANYLRYLDEQKPRSNTARIPER